MSIPPESQDVGQGMGGVPGRYGATNPQVGGASDRYLSHLLDPTSQQGVAPHPSTPPSSPQEIPHRAMQAHKRSPHISANPQVWMMSVTLLLPSGVPQGGAYVRHHADLWVCWDVVGGFLWTCADVWGIYCGFEGVLAGIWSVQSGARPTPTPRHATCGWTVHSSGAASPNKHAATPGGSPGPPGGGLPGVSPSGGRGVGGAGRGRGGREAPAGMAACFCWGGRPQVHSRPTFPTIACCSCCLCCPR